MRECVARIEADLQVRHVDGRREPHAQRAGELVVGAVDFDGSGPRDAAVRIFKASDAGTRAAGQLQLVISDRLQVLRRYEAVGLRRN